MGAPKPKSHNLTPVLLLIAVWAASEILINPRGNFPLNDDWWYARTVSTLLAQHKLEMPFFPSMTLIAHVLWGTLFSLVFGFSFNVLRLSTLFLGLTGVLATYGLLREIGASRLVAFIGAMTVALNPIYAELSNTFMTDVPFFAFALLSIYLYVRGIGRESKAEIIAGTLIACVATLMRQIGVIPPICFAVAYLIKNGIRPRSIATALLPVALVAATLLGYQEWLSVSGNMPAKYAVQEQFAQHFLHAGLRNIIIATADFADKGFVYLGLFLLPFLLPGRGREESAGRSVLSWMPAAALFLLLTVYSMHADQWMPLKKERGNILIDCQLGPIMLFDVSYLQLPYIEHAPKLLWQALTIAGAAGGALLFRRLLFTSRDIIRSNTEFPDRRWKAVLMMSAFALYAIPMLLVSTSIYFDRYYLPLMPPLMALACLSLRPGKLSRIGVASALAALILLGGFSVAGTHDYLAWNRVRWDAYTQLVQVDKVSPYEIHGGYELNGWFGCRSKSDYAKQIDPFYAITIGPVDGYEIVKSYHVRSWLPYGQEEILVLRRL